MKAAAKECPSEYALDDYWLARERNTHPIHSHVQGCQRCQRRLAEYESIASLPRSSMPELSVRGLSGNLSGGRFERALTRWLTPPRGRWRLVVAGSAVAVVVVGMFWSASELVQRDGEGQYLGVKGRIALEIYCRREDRVFPVDPGARLFPDDMLRFVPSVPQPGYLMVISVDENGQPSLYYPMGQEIAQTTSGGRTPLPGSVILDESEGPERIFFLYSRDPFDFSSVRQGVAAAWSRVGTLGDLEELPVPVNQLSVSVLKVPRGEAP
jgi:hypothetical protein